MILQFVFVTVILTASIENVLPDEEEDWNNDELSVIMTKCNDRNPVLRQKLKDVLNVLKDEAPVENEEEKPEYHCQLESNASSLDREYIDPICDRDTFSTSDLNSAAKRMRKKLFEKKPPRGDIFDLYKKQKNYFGCGLMANGEKLTCLFADKLEHCNVNETLPDCYRDWRLLASASIYCVGPIAIVMGPCEKHTSGCK